MPEEYIRLVTTAGLAAFTNAEISGVKAKITHMAVGDSAGSYYTPNKEQTQLVNEVYRGEVDVVPYEDENGDIVPNQVSFIIDVPWDTDEFITREAGLFDLSGKLLVVVQLPEMKKAKVTQGIINPFRLEIVMTFENTDAVEITINPNVIQASILYVQNQITKHNNNIDAHKDVIPFYNLAKQDAGIFQHSFSGSSVVLDVPYNKAFDVIPLVLFQTWSSKDVDIKMIEAPSIDHFRILAINNESPKEVSFGLNWLAANAWGAQPAMKWTEGKWNEKYWS